MEIENDKTESSSLLVPLGCNIPSIKSLSFPQKAGPFKLELFYD